MTTSLLRKSGAVAGIGLFLGLCLFSATAVASDYVSVKKDGVNIRSGPETNKEVLWEVFQGFPLKIVGKQGTWAQVVDFEGDKGWVSTSLLDNTKTVIVKVNTANMRSGPSKNYEITATVKYGVIFSPVDKDGEWIKLRHSDGTTGWLHKNLLWPSD